MAVLTAVIGLPMLLLALKSRGNWIECERTSITSSWGESFNFDQVLLSSTRKSGRRKASPKSPTRTANRKRRFVVDDFKYERPTMDQILYELEQRIDPDKIVNGPPEPPPGQQATRSCAGYDSRSRTA